MQLLSAFLCLLIILQPTVQAAAFPQWLYNDNTFNLCYARALEQAFDEQRKEILKQEILHRLHLEEPPEAPPEDLVVDAETLASYRAAVALDEAISAQETAQERQEGCREKETFYAKEVMLFFPAHFEGEAPSVDTFDFGSDFDKILKRDKRGKKKDDNDKDSYWHSTSVVAKKKEEDLYYYPHPTPESHHKAEGEHPTHHEDAYSGELKRLMELLTPIRYKLSFNSSDIPSHTPVWSANLQLFKRKIKTERKRAANPTDRIEVYWISSAVDSDGKPFHYPILIASREVGTEEDRYVSFDITEGVRRWLSEGSSPQLHLEVVIRCPQSVSTDHLLLPSVQFDVPQSGIKDMNDANLVIKVLVPNNRTGHNRTKRQAPEGLGVSKEYCLANPDEINCCVRETTIDIREDLQIYWVIAPRTFQFTYCVGLCPRVWPTATLNSEYRSILRANNPTSSPEPCCIPNKTKPLVVVTYEKGRLTLKKITGMIVESCQCR